MQNTLVIESADYKFVDFYNETQIAVFSKFYGEDWVYEVRELKNLITRNDAENDITFSDDSLVLVAYNIMIRVGKFQPKIYHWWIARRYIEVYQSRGYKEMQDLYDYLGIAMSLHFANLQLDEEGLLKYENLKKSVYELSKEGFELPQFIADSVKTSETKEDNKKVSKTIKTEKKVEKTEEKDITEQWKELIPVCEVMIESTEGEEKKQWQELLDTCKIMIE
jgi:hypothetical protein